MFRIDADPTFPATVRLPAIDGAEPETFTARFRALPISTFSSYDLSMSEDTATMLRAAIADLGDIVDAAGASVPYSDELRERLLDNPLARGALFRAYVETIGQAARGN